jgi:FlaA1/EpsC-like NDP-sugar epimerase
MLPRGEPSNGRLVAHRRFWILAAALGLASLSYLGAFFIRADLALPSAWWPGILKTLPFLLVARWFAFRVYGLLQGWWAASGMQDVLDTLRAVAVGSALFVTSVVLVFGVYAVPRSVVVIDGILLVGLFSASRLLTRTWGRWRSSRVASRALVVGDLEALEPVVRDLVEGPDLGLQPVGIVDLAGPSAGLRLHGVPIVGGEVDLAREVDRLDVRTVLLVASPRDGAVVRRIVARCGRSGLNFKIVPPLGHLLAERLQPRDVRDLRVDDLLGRREVRLDDSRLRDTLTARRILITGAAGSIGSELARQIARYSPECLVLFDRNESALADLVRELARGWPRLRAVARLGDLLAPHRVREILEAHRPEIVYHAAAYKHVPMMEMNPVEAVKNNVLATRDLLRACDAAGVGTFVLISTDKAVRPINIMGATKRIAERLLQDRPEGGCRRIAVRFGNVLGSEGSVIPILLQQIREGGPVTVTHPEATRYFMTIPEAVQLVLQASAIGQGGEIFVLDMGEPVRIFDLAVALIRLAGLRPGKDIEIRITGLRPGERLHEECLLDRQTRPTGTEKLWVRRSDGSEPPIGPELTALERHVERYDRDAVPAWLRRNAGGHEERPG